MVPHAFFMKESVALAFALLFEYWLYYVWMMYVIIDIYHCRDTKNDHEHSHAQKY